MPEMNRVPETTLKLVKDVEPGSLVYLSRNNHILVGLKGSGEEDGDEVHILFVLKSSAEDGFPPALIVVDENERVLSLGKSWTMHLPLEPSRMTFRASEMHKDGLGVIVHHDAWYLRIISDLGQQRPIFMNLSTGRVDFSLPDRTGVFVDGWKLTLDGVDDYSLHWPPIQD